MSVCLISPPPITRLWLLAGLWAASEEEGADYLSLGIFDPALCLIPGAFCVQLIPDEQHACFCTSKLICATPRANAVIHQYGLFRPGRGIGISNSSLL